MDSFIEGLSEVECDVLVIGGGTAGPMAALKAKQRNPNLNVILLEKANVKRSGAISMGMDGLNNAVVPGYATPEQYTKEITIANDGIVDQAPVYKYASRCYEIIEELDRFGIRFRRTPMAISISRKCITSALMSCRCRTKECFALCFLLFALPRQGARTLS